MAHEQAINKVVAQMGVTRIIIAHRVETIVAADRVYALVGGKLQEVTQQFAPLKQQILGRAE
jgi:ATP-binding cassette subfamily B protein RaxB